MLTTRAPGRPRDERASSAITDAALRQLGEWGYGKVTMESVATEAGVARATIYRRYRDKADLVTAAIAGNNASHLAEGPSNDPRGDLIDYLNEFDERFGESCLEVVGTLIGAREDPAALDLHRQRVVGPRMRYARSLLATAVGMGQLRPDANLDLALQMLAGSVFARRVAGQPSTPGWAEQAVAAVWTGMGTP
jgi:AcrR family transcriptional regulator